MFEPGRLAKAVLVGLAVCLATVSSADAARRHRHHATAKVQRGGGGGDDDVGSSSSRYAAYVVDDKTGRVLFSKNADAPRHPASLTKMMTLYLLFEDLRKGRVTMETRFTVSQHAANQAPSKLGFRPGQTIAVEDAIRALVTKSANDVAVTVAENIGGSEEAFARRMTATSRRIGMTGSTFYNASGLPNAAQYTTAHDMVTLGRALQERFPTYYRYFSTRSFAWGNAVHANHNKLLFRIEGIDGIKTGYTEASGFNLVSSLRRDNRHLVAAVMGGSSGRSRDDHMAKLLAEHLGEASTGAKTSSVFAENRSADAADTDETEAPATVVARAPAPTPPAAPAPARPAIASLPAPTPASTAPLALVAVETDAPYEPARTAGPRGGNLPRIASSDQVPLPRAEVESRVSTDRGAAVAMAKAILLPDTGRPIARSDTPMPVRTASISVTPIVTNAAPVAAKVDEVKAPPAPPRSLAVATLTGREAAEIATASIARRKAEEPASPPATVRSEVHGWLVQIGAYDREDAAKAALAKARDRLGGVLGRVEDVTEGVTSGAGRLWRARFAGLKDQKAAEGVCKALKRKDFACLALRQ